MKIKEIRIEGLFGMFNHAIPFKDGNLTVIYGINGIGKTMCFRVLDCLLNRNFDKLATLPFKKVVLLFENDLAILPVEKRIFLFENEGDCSVSKQATILPFLFEITAFLMDRERLKRYQNEGITEAMQQRIVNDTDKLNLFFSILNTEKLQYKTISVSNKNEIEFTNVNNQKLEFHQLSNGEQFIIILFYLLLFEIPDNALVLIEEPENSLHITWQKAFLKDIKAIIALRGFDMLISTHSPAIIDGEWDLTVALKD